MTAFALTSEDNKFPVPIQPAVKPRGTEIEPTVRFATGEVETYEYEYDRDMERNSHDVMAKNSPFPSPPEQPQDHEPAAQMIEVIRDCLYFLPTNDMRDIQLHAKRSDFRFMTSNLHSMYESFCDDFGPIAISQVIRFCRAMAKVFQNKEKSNRCVVYYCQPTPRRCSNTVFLIICYLVLELGWRVTEALAPFQALDPAMTEPFRDATWISPPTSFLHIGDCVGGLLKALKKGWLDNFNMSKYEQLYDPLHGNITEICSKVVAFKGPVAAADIEKGDLTSFPPHFYAHALKRMKVDAVVRLNEPSTYDPSAFTDVGIAHYDLFFEDCTVPPLALVTRFLDLCEQHPRVAVHCTAGLGRTGTMIAAWLMRRCAFLADEAVGFLRVMRPGSVIGPQQPFLQLLGNAYWSGNSILLPAALPRSLSSPPAHTPASASGSAPATADAQEPQGHVLGGRPHVQGGGPQRAASETGPESEGFARAESLFGGLMRVQLAKQLAQQVREASLRRANCLAGQGSCRAVDAVGDRPGDGADTLSLTDADSQ